MNNSTEDSFIDAVEANSHDKASRLVFADWLEEQGEGRRAEFIRLHCDSISAKSAARHREFYQEFRKELADQLPGEVKIPKGRPSPEQLHPFQRGAEDFPRWYESDILYFDWKMEPRQADLYYIYTQGRFFLDWSGHYWFSFSAETIPTDIGRLAQLPFLSRIRGIRAEDYRRFEHPWDAQSERTEYLAAIKEFFSSSSLSQLRYLEFTYENREHNLLDDDGLCILADAPNLKSLTTLNLFGGCRVTLPALRALVRSPHLTNLKDFRIATFEVNYYGDDWPNIINQFNEGVSEYLYSPNARALNRFATLYSPQIAQALIRSPSLKNLRQLDLHFVNTTTRGNTLIFDYLQGNGTPLQIPPEIAEIRSRFGPQLTLHLKGEYER